ncbi:MAG: hypothetical protein AMJ60_05595 [Desulfobacterales bacterium SG8_35]|nr:MAG: hypothetical protein AMJ60_05595 [Desulfobacterales bacterium SG8_35]
MKRLAILAIALLATFLLFNNSYGRTFYRTFEVVEIQPDGIVLQDFEGSRLLVDKAPNGLKVGDIVRYDTVRNVLKISPWQPAKVINMTDRTVTLQLNNDDYIEINMRSSYQNQFQVGDTIQYKASSGQIKKSDLGELKE